MIVLRLLLFALLVLAVPTVVGSLAADIETTGRRGRVNLPLWWVSGQLILWAGFQLICVPMVLAERHFQDVVFLFSGFMAAMVLLAVAVNMRRRVKSAVSVRVVESAHEARDPVAVILWICVAVLLALQLVLAVVLAYEEGDDAFYVAVSVITEEADTMYQKLPYTGGTTGLDTRHGLAPFPVWVAYLSRLTGIRAVTMAQVVLPVVLIAMCYIVFYLIGKRLFRDERRKLPLFLLFIETLVLFGGYSLQSAENFLLVRTAQGKAVLADIVIPFLFFLFLGILEELQLDRKTGVWRWLMVAVTMAAGCLCSTEATLLTCMLLGIVGLCMVVCYRRWRLLLSVAGCGAVPVVMMILYFVLK